MKLTRLFVSLAALCAGGIALRAADTPATAVAPAAQNDGPPYGYHVKVKLHMNTDGRPESIEIVSSDDTTTEHILNKVAMAIAAHSSLPPRMKNGVPEKFVAVQPFFFPIEDDEGPESNKVPMPRVKSGVMPIYPQSLADAQEVGGAIFDFRLDESGKVIERKTMRASSPDVERAAQEALDKWVFTPAESNGQPVASHFRLAIVFEGFGKFAEPKWSVAPRPALGSFFVIKRSPADADAPTAEPSPAGAPAPGTKPADPVK